MSEFDEALARAVEDGTARGRLPGAADALRRGRRRSLRARGGVALAGVAAVGGALGVTSALGGPAGPGAVGPGGRAVHADDGILPAAQWPGYDLSHWKVSPSCGEADRSKCHPGDPTVPFKQVQIGGFTGQWCAPGPSLPVQRWVAYGTQRDEARKLDAGEMVFTYPDAATAASVLAFVRPAGSPATCATGDPDVELHSPGVSTAAGVSWVLTQPHRTPADSEYTHCYLVQVDNRVALLRVNQDGGDTFAGTGGDEAVLRNLEAALSR